MKETCRVEMGKKTWSVGNLLGEGSVGAEQGRSRVVTRCQGKWGQCRSLCNQGALFSVLWML